VPRRFLILDACVIIDFVEVDRTLFKIVRDAVGVVHVATRVLHNEVTKLDASDVEALGVKLVTPSLAMMSEAALAGGGLSPRDWVCVLLAEERGWTCVSNDKRMRAECTRRSVDVLWGLELIAMAVEAGALPATAAGDVGREICRLNPRMTAAVLAAFLKRVAAARRGGRRG